MTFLLGLLGNPLVRKALMYAAIAAAVAVAYTAWAHHIRAAARAEIVAKYEAATAAEHQRRDEVIAAARREADQAAERITEMDRKYADSMQEIARLSARNDGRACLDRDSARRLRAIGGDRQQAGGGAAQPAR